MMKNRKIAEYLDERSSEKVHEISAYLEFFIKHLDELEKVLTENERLWREDSMRKYSKLAEYIDHKHRIKWKDGGKIPPTMTRNFYKLACKEREVSLPKPSFQKKQTTVFRVYCPGDDCE